MGLFVFLLLSLKSSLHIFMQTVFICYAFCKCFLPDCGLSSDSLDIACHTAEVFNFDSVTHMSLEQKFGVVSRWRLVSALGFPEQRGQPSCGRLLTSRTVG